MGSTDLTGTKQESTIAARCIAAGIAMPPTRCRPAVLFSSLFFGMKGLYFNDLILIARRLARTSAEIDAAADGTAAVQSLF